MNDTLIGRDTELRCATSSVFSRAMRWCRNSSLMAAIVAVGLASCVRRPAPPPSATAPPQAAPLTGLTVTAIPVYRLIATPVMADLPSRLVVLQVRIDSTLDRAVSFSPDDISFVLASGQRGVVFDRGRAMELLRRTTLGDADLSYAQRSYNYPPGGFDQSAAAQLSDTVTSNLLSEQAFTNEQAIQGYVVVDTGVPLTTLSGSTVEVVVYRLSDSQPAGGQYQFAAAEPAAPAATEAP